MSGLESHAHRLAVDLMLGWLREAARKVGLYGGCARLGALEWQVTGSNRQHWRVWREYPFVPEVQTSAWDETNDLDGYWRERPPTREEIIAAGYRPRAIADIAIQCCGDIWTVIEITHKHPLDKAKLKFLSTQVSQVLEIPARWVLGQVAVPTRIPREFWRIGE